ncbi:unnamed protein product [Fusarium graminearum]|uniref:Uncharacterized protein n=1 Tax=Gibberella zeae TaxID=5518 RepID=A0A4U9F7C6_GIBZA|nr:unnamed protein product [Fusarium graminearum]CAF3575600.1 unnamed protein product [Fusarium graminearum]CAF3602814.1 unnamed protein product [Fusarium graminearum]CAG1972938.1 unnamed protein product [Fusarium graminearum]CAG1986308.1 unnamed protein product [Fusarium graminearum]
MDTEHRPAELELGQNSSKSRATQILSAQIGLGSLIHCDITTSKWSERSRGLKKGKACVKGWAGDGKETQHMFKYLYFDPRWTGLNTTPVVADLHPSQIFGRKGECISPSPGGKHGMAFDAD